MARLLEKLDAWITNRVFQPVVDASQLRPVWWGRQAAVVLLIVGIVRAVSTGYSVLAVIYVLAMVVWLLATLIEPLYASLAESTWVRYFALFDTAMTIFALLLPLWGEQPDRLARWVVGSAGFTSYFYFATCRPPRPRQPRRKLVLSRVG